MKLIPKYQNAPGPLVPSWQAQWVTEAKEREKHEDQEYQQFISSPYYKIHQKPTKQQWRQIKQKLQNRGTIKEAEKVSAPVRAINNYVREYKYDMSQGNVPKGKHSLPLLGLAATGIGSFLSAPITTTAAMAGGWAGGKALDSGMKLATGKSWAENMYDWTGLDKEPAEVTNPGMWVGGYQVPRYSINTMRRGVETAMRTSPMQDGLTTILNNGKQIIKDRDFQRMRTIGKYIFTGRTTGNKGYYNSLRAVNPEENYYGGFDWIPEKKKKKNDAIDAFLYRKEIDPGFGLYKKAQGKDFGIHTDYVANNYPGKAKNIQVYSTSETEPLSGKIKVTGSKGTDNMIETEANVGYDAAGHRLIEGVDAAGNKHIMEQDIWKFKPKEYIKKWLDNNNNIDLPLWKKTLMRVGLEATDCVGTPVIVRTPWKKATTFDTSKATLKGDLSAPPSEITINMDDLLKNVDLNNLTQYMK